MYMLANMVCQVLFSRTTKIDFTWELIPSRDNFFFFFKTKFSDGLLNEIQDYAFSLWMFENNNVFRLSQYLKLYCTTDNSQLIYLQTPALPPRVHQFTAAPQTFLWGAASYYKNYLKGTSTSPVSRAEVFHLRYLVLLRAHNSLGWKARERILA